MRQLSNVLLSIGALLHRISLLRLANFFMVTARVRFLLVKPFVYIEDGFVLFQALLDQTLICKVSEL